jgi:Holliday junction resolvase
MTTRQSHKRRGKGFESDLVAWLRAQGYDAERLPLAGTKDEGDIVVRHGSGKGAIYDVIECKAPGAGNAIDLSGWLREAETEAANFAAARGIDPANVNPVVAIKARGKGIDQAYIVSRAAREYR